MTRCLTLAAAFSMLFAAPLSAQLCDSEYENQVIVRIRHIVFQGAADIPRTEREAIATEIRKHFRNPCRSQLSWSEDTTYTASETARQWYQDRGFFKAQVDADTVLIEARGLSRTVDFRLTRIEEDYLYHVGTIRWSGVSVFPEDELLHLMPIHTGEIFSRSKIATGLEAVNSLYASHGYINFFSIPNTILDEEGTTISINTQVDEGPQFHFRDLSVAGLDQQRTQQWQNAWGKQVANRVFSQDDLRAFLQQLFRPAIPHFDPVWATRLQYDEKSRAVDVFMTFYPPPSDGAANPIARNR